MNTKYGRVLRFLFITAALTIMPFTSSSQETISPYVTLQYFKNTDNQRILRTILTYSKNRMEIPIPGMDISFYSDAEDRVFLAKPVTDEKGIAEYKIPEDLEISADADGYWAFSSEYDGNDTIEAGISEIAIKDIDLEMTLSEIDSIKTITLHVTAVENGEPVPVAGEMIIIYIPRMFSLLPVAEAFTDDYGDASVEFPSDIPGDNEGNLKIIARFDDHPTYGTVERSIDKKWGVPTEYSVPTSHRALWTHMPPTWMIVTLLVLLTGVWAHYFFAVISLWLIRRDAKRKEAKDNYRI